MEDDYDIFNKREIPPVSSLIRYPTEMIEELDDNPCLEFVTIMQAETKRYTRGRTWGRPRYVSVENTARSFAIYRIIKERILPEMFAEGDLVDDEMADLLGIGIVAPEGTHLTEFDINPKPRSRYNDYYDEFDDMYDDIEDYDYYLSEEDEILDVYYDKLTDNKYEVRSKWKRIR